MLHASYLRIIYNDKQLSCTELLDKNSFVSIYIRNIQRLAFEMFRFHNGLSPPLMNNIFKLRAENPYKLRHVSEISRPIVKSAYHRTESISYLNHKYETYGQKKLKNIRAFNKED